MDAGRAEFGAAAEALKAQYDKTLLKKCGAAITSLRSKFSAINLFTQGTNDVAGNRELHSETETTGQFGNNFFKTVANDTPGNLIMSALSAEIVLAMTAYGAGGRTATQMRSALFIPADDEVGQSGYQSIIETLSAVTEVELRLANKMYIASRFEVKPGFQELTVQKFHSSSEKVYFGDSTNAAKTINSWCEEKTNNRIKDLLSEESLNSDTVLVLVNAVYFKGQWDQKFNPSYTEDRPFYIDEHNTKYVPTMYVKNRLRFGKLPELSARFIEIPYKGKEFSMIIILPDEVNGLQIIQDNLRQVNLKQSLQRSYPSGVEIYLPKFKTESTLDLQKPLEKLGMTDMFTMKADFSGISDSLIYVSKVIQKAYIEVNEEGTEAAVVSCSVSEALSELDDAIFEVDRPFYYAIYHHGTGISLFTGILRDPDLM